MQATAPSAEKKSSSCQVSVCFKLVNPLFFEANDRIEEKNRLNRLQMDFSAPFCFQVTKLRKEDKNGFFFCIKKEHFSMYLYVKQCAIENEVNSRSRLLHVCQ